MTSPGGTGTAPAFGPSAFFTGDAPPRFQITPFDGDRWEESAEAIR
jgi:hypothetical protein